MFYLRGENIVGKLLRECRTEGETVQLRGSVGRMMGGGGGVSAFPGSLSVTNRKELYFPSASLANITRHTHAGTSRTSVALPNRWWALARLCKGVPLATDFERMNVFSVIT